MHVSYSVLENVDLAQHQSTGLNSAETVATPRRRMTGYKIKFGHFIRLLLFLFLFIFICVFLILHTSTSNAMDFDWSDAAAKATACNSTLQSALDTALAVPIHSGQGYTSIEYVAVWACRYSPNASIAKSAYNLWPNLNGFGYYPSAILAIIAMVIFGVSGALHCYQIYRSRRWAYCAVVIGAGLEVYGWQQRYSAHSDVMYGYITQLAGLTIAPTAYAGGIYALFYALSCTQDSRLVPLMRPKAFSWVLFGVEVLTLSIQAAGGVLAASVGTVNTFHLGTSIMTAGTALQTATSVVFTGLVGVYASRVRRSRDFRLSLDNTFGRILICIFVMEGFLIIRGSYRTAELSQGLKGALARNETALIGGDFIPVVIVAILLNVSHPSHTLKNERRSAPVVSRSSSDLELKNSGSAV